MLVTTRPWLLFIAPWFLFPANTGGRIRTRDILRGLKGGRFDITLVSPQPEPGTAPQSELSGVCDRFVGWPSIRRGPLFAYSRLRYLPSAVPISVATDWSAAGQRVVDAELARRPDVVVVDFAHTVVFAPERFESPSVLFTHNVEAQIFARHAKVAKTAPLRAVWRNQHAKMVRFEGAALGRFDGVIAVSEQDREVFVREYGLDRDRAFVIPTGVDLEYFGADPNGASGCGSSHDASLVFTGSMDWMPNIDAMEYFMDEVWPLIATQRADVRFVVVGRDPPRRLVDAARRRALAWEFTGRVDDVRPHVRAAQAYVIPLRVGGGTRLKVFEAMAMACPMVSTGVGVEGLPLEADRHYLRADTPKDFAAAILRLLADPGLRQRLARAARDYVAENFSARRVAETFEDICASVAGLERRAVDPRGRRPVSSAGADAHADRRADRA